MVMSRGAASDGGAVTAVDDTLSPRPMADRPRSNAFHYTLDAVVGALAHPRWELCPVRSTAHAWPVGRALFLRRNGRVARFRTDTRDFSNDALAHTVRVEGQIYLDVSQKPAPNDFARDLVALTRSEVCTGCPAYEYCAGLYDPRTHDANVFLRDDTRVRTLIEGLRGTVLDVGCGEGPYADLFEASVRAGVMAYVGLDPDAATIATLAHRWPWATLYPIAAEAYVPDAPLDHVLILRSWNHLRNPVQVLETFAEVLRPGGTLTVVDNVAFGLVRGRAHARAAERSPARFEHLRNDGAAEAHARITRVLPGFSLVERHDVSPATSNQWLLRYVR